MHAKVKEEETVYLHCISC